MTGRAWLGIGLALALGGGAARAQPPRPSESQIFSTPVRPSAPEEKKPAQEPAKPEEKPAAEEKATEEKATEAKAIEEKIVEETRVVEPATAVEKEAPPTIERGPDSARDDAILGVSETGRLSDDAAPDDPLKIGGMFYLRAQTTARKDESADDWSLGAPSLLDAYLDARPNERVRGLIVGRLVFDPTLPTDAVAPAPSQIRPVETSGGGASMGTSDLTSLFAGQSRGPHVSLDQMWLRFDLAHRVFVTAGKQHVRWGTARFWTPTDFLHIRRRNPLDVFDARTGTTMVKLHAPWEAMGWNIYGYGLLEDSVATPRLGNVAGAARAEVVLGTSELGAGALVRRGRKPRIGFDVSAGVWDLDLYGELALRWGNEIDRISVATEPVSPETLAAGQFAVVEAMYPLQHRSGVKSQVVGGATYARKYNDNDVFNVGVEYFYNPLGYDDHHVYPGLVLRRSAPLNEAATFFYLGRHYGALYLNLPAPYSWDYTSFTLSTLGNLSDRSFISRLDYGLVLLTHLRFEAYAAVRYGNEEGEFRFGIKRLEIAGIPFSTPPGTFDLGIGLRVSL